MSTAASAVPRRPWWADAYTWIALAFAALAGTQPLRSFDLFWHLATGRYIVANGALPTTDPFRFTSNHAAWVDHSWLSQLAFYGVERAFGANGLVVLGALVTVAIAALLLGRFQRYGLFRALPALIVVLAIFGARPRLMVRPELVSLLFLVVLIRLLERFSAGKSRKNAAFLALLVVLWANFHPGALVAPLVAAAFLLGCKLQRAIGSMELFELETKLGRRDAERSQPMTWLHVIGVPALLAASVLATPAGGALYAVPLDIRRALAGLPVVNPEWLPVWQSAWQAYAAGLALLLACLTWAGWKRGFDLPGLLAGSLLSVLAASAARHQGLFFIGAAFTAARALASVPARRVRRNGRNGNVAITAAAVVVPVALALWCFAPPPSGPLRPRQAAVRPGFGIEPGLFPDGAIQLVAAHPEIGPLYNDVAFGGYLLWRTYPEREVFWDGRNEVDPDFLRAATMARGSENAWVALLDRFGIDAALVHYREGRWRVLLPGSAGAGTEPVYRSASQVHFPRERFALVQWDDAGMLFVRRTEARAGWLAAQEFTQVHPEALEETVAVAASSPAQREAVLAELDRHDRQSGPCGRAEILRAELLGIAGREAR